MKQEQAYRNVWFPFSFLDRKRIISYLEKKAAEGWLVDEIGDIFWRFRRTEPRRLTFSVVYLEPKDYGKMGSGAVEQFYGLCAHDGWSHAESRLCIQVLYTEDPSPKPIDTDPVLELERMHRVTKKQLWSKAALAVCVFFTAAVQFDIYPIGGELGRLASWPAAVAGLSAAAGILLLLGGILRYYIWLWGARRKVKNGFSVPENVPGYLPIEISYVTAQLSLIMAFLHGTLGTEYRGEWKITMPLLLGLMAVIVFFVLRLCCLNANHNPDPKKKQKIICLCVVFGASVTLFSAGHLAKNRYFEKRNLIPYESEGKTYYAAAEELQLDVGPLLGMRRDAFSRSLVFSAQSPWMYYELGSIRARADVSEEYGMRYYLLRIHAAQLYDRAEEMCMDLLRTESREKITESDAAPWRARRAYAAGTEWYLADYGDCILIVRFDDFMPDAAQMEMLATQLGK